MLINFNDYLSSNKYVKPYIQSETDERQRLQNLKNH